MQKQLYYQPAASRIGIGISLQPPIGRVAEGKIWVILEYLDLVNLIGVRIDYMYTASDTWIE